MHPNPRRQLKDIQFKAERLINGRPTMEEIEEFDQYNEELKKYLISNLSDPELIERARQIPKVLEETNGQVAARGVIGGFLAIFASGLTSYFQERQRIENAMELIRDARGAYASIEFFIRNAE